MLQKTAAERVSRAWKHRESHSFYPLRQVRAKGSTSFMMTLVRTLAVVLLALAAVPAVPQTINTIVPTSAPSWSRVLITGTGLDAAGLRVQFPARVRS